MRAKLTLLMLFLLSTASPGQTISVSPQTATVAVGATKQLTRSGTAIWSSSDTTIATVSSVGLVKAKKPGVVVISVTTGGPVAVSRITVPGTVVVTPPPPPTDTTPAAPPASGIWRSHEPAGSITLAERSFTSISEGWGNAGLTLASDASAPMSPASVLRVTYPAGYAGGSAPGYAEATFSGSRVLYLTYWAKLSANFYGHPTSFNKQLYTWANNAPLFFLDASGTGTGKLVPKAVLQGTPADAVLLPNLDTAAVIPRGRWYNVEVLLTGNTSGLSNGAVDWWVDGVHVGSVAGRRFTTGTTSWDILTFRPVWGGQGGTVPATMTLDMDHIYISGKN